MTDFLDIICGPCSRAPKKFITYSWFSSVVLVAVIFVVACITANRVSSSNRAAGFAVVWTALLCVLLSIGGTIIMRKYQTPIALGYLLGCVLMMAQQCLILTAVFGGIADKNLETHGATSGATAAAVFLFLLFMVYGFFGSLLLMFRSKVLADTAGSDMAPPDLGPPPSENPPIPYKHAHEDA